MDGSKHVRSFSEAHMRAGESVVAWCQGYIGDMWGTGEKKPRSGALIVTKDRVVFYRKGVFGEVQESIPLRSITSIERRSVLGHRTLRLHTSHDQLEFKTNDKEAESASVEAIETGRTRNWGAIHPQNDDELPTGLQSFPQKPSQPQALPDPPTVQVHMSDAPEEQQAKATRSSDNLPLSPLEDASLTKNRQTHPIETLLPPSESPGVAPQPARHLARASRAAGKALLRQLARASMAVGKALFVVVVMFITIGISAASRPTGLVIAGGLALWAGMVIIKRTRRAIVATLFRVPIQKRRVHVASALGELLFSFLLVALTLV